jgi:N6-adenosine-specific RNA methylase IME4
MSIDELCNMEIPKTEDNAVLFLWVTWPFLEKCFKVIKAWGFQYKTGMCWDKVKHNFGYYVSVRSELMLISTKGSCTPDVKKLYDNVISIERTKHSEKPERFRGIIDELYPTGNRIELFARKKVKGWDSWGLDL